uniref:VLIG-type G domain-containing protein n=1 Tax=Mola mola TaxID=94237 RepID=A0A3Q3W4S4_MOLML
VNSLFSILHQLLGKLQLQEKYPQMLTTADFLKIVAPVKQDTDISEKDLAQIFLQRLMLLDYRARHTPVRQDSPEVSQSNPASSYESFETEERAFDAFYNTILDDDKDKQSHVHPMDVQMVVFRCSDNFLKQTMIKKLSQCQYALPLLVPDPVTMDIDCPLWTMPICKADTPMVSFLRLGSPSVSKSQLMNILINSRHNTFFHRECHGSTKSCHLMDGVAEIAWYCPAGKPSDAFTDCTAFCNLHGDALLAEKQRDILTEKSSVNVVLVPTLKKGDKSSTVIFDLLKSEKPLICLIVDEKCDVVETPKGKYKVGLKDRSQSDISEELKRIFRSILSGSHVSFKLEAMAEISGIRVDEDEEVCQKGKSAAMRLVHLLQGIDISKIKDKFLPCQGKLWHKWCSTNKEMYHLKGHTEMERSKKQEELTTLREEQCASSCSDLMKLFIESLSTLKSADKEYFLRWTQILIDDLSTDDLSLIHQSYNEKWSEVQTLKKHDKSDQLTRKQSELDEISKKLQSATFGLEHIYREMGQIYEAHASLQKPPKRRQMNWSKYPEMAAELMISGHPMELMDGDAGHVPLTWISSLLNEVVKKLGNKSVYVLSVLGIQSSGKSTMLNAMFGLQFAVSAGRCTKGAFMQLVEVSEEMKEHFKFDYFLVVDTEGLRALELAGNSTFHHDNELATFVVGLGNMTLINIFGENPAEMQDVLQIVVQAFMRMKKVNLSPSCVFVHQNVTDIGASEKNMDGKRNLQQILDQMAQLAAKEEVCDYECFSDVITFNVQEDVKYFAQLWEGSPPMAPPNPGYSESIQELKSFILSKASHSAGTTLSQFRSKVQDLWDALLNENFVFSFKNTHEISVYRKLEDHYRNWTWTLRNSMLTFENQLYTRIENGSVDKVDHNDLYKGMTKTYEDVQKDLRTYFDDDEDKEMLAQWRGRFVSKITDFHDEQVKAVKRKLEEVIQQKKACKELDDKKIEFEKKLLQKSKELAQRLKDKAKDEAELEKQFDYVWSELVHKLTAGTKPIEDIDLETDKLSILAELGFEWAFIDESKNSGTYKKMSKVGNYIEYVYTKQQNQPGKKEKGKKEQFLPNEEQQQIRSLINNFETQSLDTIKSKPVATTGYNLIYLQEVAKNVKDTVTEFESKEKYGLKKEFTVDLLLYVFDSLETWLKESHKKFQTNNDVRTYEESKKKQYYKVFTSFCKGSSSAVVFGELICEKLKSSTVEAVCNNTAIDLANIMMCNYKVFNGNRLNLEKHVLTSLVEKQDFDGFITYIKEPRKQVETFIKAEVKKYIFKENKTEARNVLKRNVEDITRFLNQALYDSTENVKKMKKQSQNIAMWVKEFSSLIKDKIAFSISCQNFSDINNFDFLKEEIKKGLESVMEEMRDLNLDNMNRFRIKPDEILINQLCQRCWVTCPFCGAVCVNIKEDHSPEKHSVPFHRPAAVNGVCFDDTKEADIDFCTTSVASDDSFYPDQDSQEDFLYKQHHKAGSRYADGSITLDLSRKSFWRWFVCQFQVKLEDHYGYKFQGRGEIPNEWNKHTKERAIRSLDEI